MECPIAPGSTRVARKPGAEARAAIAAERAEKLAAVAADCAEKRAATRAIQAQIDVFAAFDEQARQQRHHLEQIQNKKERCRHTDRVRQLSEQTQQTPISQAPISTPLTPHFSRWGEWRFHSISAGSTQAQCNRKLK